MVHISFNVQEGEGIELSKTYKVGHTFPVFILTDGNGDIIYRWTGYTGAPRFISSLNKGMSDLTTVKERIAMYDSDPTHDRALLLARYFVDTGEYLDAIAYFREAEKLKPSSNIDYSYDIFANSANAAWKDMLSFEEVLSVADSILYASNKDNKSIVRVARAMSRLTRKLEKEEYVKKYLQAGLDAAAGSRDEKNRDTHTSLSIEYALQVENDTIKAITMKKKSMGTDWTKNPEKFYNYSKWCLERKVALSEAEMLAKKAAHLAKGAEFKAQVYNTIAEICFARGNLEEAIKIMDLAIEQDPGNMQYQDRQEQYLEQWEKR
ncbi:MAG: tetratricopeptide repeat protein [Candidatus Zixiibacteriota bacterium]|nr:MAG: tetratricopeptide repeat protein [candidate division Zixibacteria bacterium]